MSASQRTRQRDRLDRRVWGAGVLGALFLAAAVLAFALLVVRDRQLMASVRDNAVWGAFQLDREGMRLAIILGKDPSERKQREIRDHFDILYSRTQMLDGDQFRRIFGADPEIMRTIAKASAKIKALAPILDVSADTISNETIAELQAGLADLRLLTNEIVVEANSLNSDRMWQERVDTTRLYWLLGACVAALAVVGFAIIWFLIRQLAELRASRAELESLTDELEKKAAEALAGSRAKSQFLATMSHEIRTPMNGVIGAADLMLDTDLDAQQIELARMISTCGEALLEIINDVLDYSKLEAGKLDLETTSFDIRQTARSVVTIVQPKAAEKAIELRLRVAEETPQILIGDQGRIRQLLVNLMSNGVKFTQKGHVSIDIDYVGSADARKLHVTVTDTGMGIAPEAMKGLFIEFNQLEASTARRFGGTGLGLAICKRLVTMMGGEIGVDSILGLGSSFWFEIPMKPGVYAAPMPETRSPEPAARSGLQILVADDNAVNRQIVSKILFKLGHRVDLVCNGREAVAAAASGDYDLVFMDVQMPEMDGYAATRAIRALATAARDVPIVALTANASDEDRVSCLAAGMDAFATKPVSKARLEAVIRQLKSAGDPLVAVEAARDVVEFDATIREALRAEVGDDGLAEFDQQLAVDVAGLWPEIERAAATCDRQGLRRACHTLRGAASSLGFGAIVEATDGLREACVSGPDPTVATAVERLAGALRRSKMLGDRARDAA